jgi:hypothetical protein
MRSHPAARNTPARSVQDLVAPGVKPGRRRLSAIDGSTIPHNTHYRNRIKLARQSFRFIADGKCQIT